MTAAQRWEDNPCRPRHFKPAPCAPIASDTPATHSLDTCRTRMLVSGALFALLFLVLAARLIQIVLIEGVTAEGEFARPYKAAAAPLRRADIVDRNGVLLATTLSSPSLYADPRHILNAAAATRALTETLPGLNPAAIYARLTSRRTFVWLARHLTPHQEYDVNRLGIPGFGFLPDERRFYPLGDLAAHALGYVSIDNKGMLGAEAAFNRALDHHGAPLQLSLDARVQFVLHQELQSVIDDFSAKGAAGIIMNVRTGEILAMASLPDFDPNHPTAIAPGQASSETRNPTFDKVTLGDYELGSVFKIFTIAMALDDGVATMTSRYDAVHPLHIGRFTITDYHGKHRWLSVPEILAYSSNIGAARIALEVGEPRQKAFLAKLGLLKAPQFPFAEVSAPRYPKDWRKANVMTIAFGHGISISPLAFATAACAIVNGGILRPPTIRKLAPGEVPQGVQVIGRKTSIEMRKLMRLVVEYGTGRMADAPGYVVGGKTGTADIVRHGHYLAHELRSSFLGVFPIDHPRYLIFTLVNEPHGTVKSHGYATAGWTVAPATKRIIERIAPLLGVPPVNDDSPAVTQALTIASLPGNKIAPY